MIKIKILAVFIFIFGLTCLLFALYMFLNLESNLQLWENLQRAGLEGAKSISRAELRSGIVTSAIWYAVIGLLSFISGIGLFLLKNWARQLWLGVLVLLTGICFYWLVSNFQRGFLDIWDLIGYLFFGIIIAAMFIFLNKLQIKELFAAQKS
jgi:hypothetical protein